MITWLRTLVGLNKTAARPPITGADPRILVVTFFFFLVTISNVTSPVGIPPPGACGWIWAPRVADISFFFLRVSLGTNTIVVFARLIDSEIGPDCEPVKFESPL